MKLPRTRWHWAALAAIPCSLLAGWLWHARHEPEYSAHARIAFPAVGDAAGPRDPLAETLEETLFAPERLVAAADLLRARGVPLPTRSPLDSEVTELSKRIESLVERHGPHDELLITWRTPDGEHAIAVLAALVDVCLRELEKNAPRVDRPDAATQRAERDQLLAALQRQEQLQAELREQLAAREANPPGNIEPASDAVAIETGLAQARERLRLVQAALVQVRNELTAGTAAEQIAASISEPAGGAAARDLLYTARLQHELVLREATRQSDAAIYGRNHPRMVTARRDVERLREELSARPLAGLPVTPQASSADLLVKACEDQVRQAQAAVVELEAQRQSAADQPVPTESLETELADAAKEQQFLQAELARVRDELQQAERELAAHAPAVIEPPTLDPFPRVPSLPRYLTWSAAIGVMLCAGFIRLSRRPKSAPAAIPQAMPASPASVAAVPGALRFRSQEEQNLARLKLLTARS